MSAMLDISKALKYPGQEYAFEAELELEEMEVLNDPVRFDDIAVKGEYFGTGDRFIDAVGQSLDTSDGSVCGISAGRNVFGQNGNNL